MVKIVLDHRRVPVAVHGAQGHTPKLGIGVESLRTWTRQALIDAGKCPGVTTAEPQRIKELEREVRCLK
ncbi:hypothetical protein [Rhodococcus opacus]|uniref:hypothetical protein n=1 Tax=Rhodococcus opacus TaxID=37919 RepID=UPI000EA96180|nr:hypothetical protein [Rhodococcus opacus]QZS52591.1 hypothetical protein FXW36_03110 [Rhodococcus opacus]RKM64866.1 hypothetical protein COO55_38225 [Rhodococcus opacus]